jgi:hypothetical protein
MNHKQGTRSSIIWISAHGRARCRQRGTSNQTLAALLEWADVEIPVGAGATALSMSSQAEDEMHVEGLAPQLIDRARRRALVEADGKIITVIVGRRAGSRRYRRALCGRPQRRRSLRRR